MILNTQTYLDELHLILPNLPCSNPPQNQIRRMSPCFLTLALVSSVFHVVPSFSIHFQLLLAMYEASTYLRTLL